MRRLSPIVTVFILVASGTVLAQTEDGPVLGKLSVFTSPPGATVFLNGQETGVTPLSEVAVPPGLVRLDLRRAGFQSHQEWLRIAAGEAARVSVDLNAAGGELLIANPETGLETRLAGPWNRVYRYQVPVGSREIQLRAFGYVPRVVSFQVEPGSTVSVSGQLEPVVPRIRSLSWGSPDTIVLETNAPGAYQLVASDGSGYRVTRVGEVRRRRTVIPVPRPSGRRIQVSLRLESPGGTVERVEHLNLPPERRRTTPQFMPFVGTLQSLAAPALATAAADTTLLAGLGGGISGRLVSGSDVSSIPIVAALRYQPSRSIAVSGAAELSGSAASTDVRTVARLDAAMAHGFGGLWLVGLEAAFRGETDNSALGFRLPLGIDAPRGEIYVTPSVRISLGDAIDAEPMGSVGLRRGFSRAAAGADVSFDASAVSGKMWALWWPQSDDFGLFTSFFLARDLEGTAMDFTATVGAALRWSSR